MKNLDGFKILQIVKGIDIGGNSGGAESFGIRLARALKENGKDVSICAFFKFDTSVEKDWYNQLNNDGIDVFYANPSRKLNLFESRKKIRNWLRGNYTNIVHSHYQIGTIISISLKFSNLYQFLVRTAHIDLEFGQGIPGKVSRVAFQNFLYPLFVDREVGVSRSITQRTNRQIVRRILNKPAVWIPNAVPEIIKVEQYEDRKEKYRETKSGKPWNVTAIGILVSRKNIDLLIRSMVKVIDQIPNARLVIAGDGPEFTFLVRLSRELNIYDSCSFLGQQQNIQPILEESNILILPSSSEGISTVILEAMQNNVPVIASDIAGNRELIQDGINGWLVPLGDGDELTNAIIRAYHYPGEIQQLAEEAHKRIDIYSMATVGNKYMQLYMSLMQTK
jgi:glycosyltransferase involved in cell wall biosynthesis